MRFGPFVLALSALLSACAPGPDGAAQRATINAMEWEAADQPFVVMDLPARNTVAVLGLAGQNGKAMTWASGDQRGLVIEDGIVRRSAGFGSDLMAADTAPVLAALAGGSRSYTREYRHLSADNRTVNSQQSCTMSGPVTASVTIVGRARAAQLWTESCETPDGPVTNRFWRDGGRNIASEQWLSAQLGSVRVEFPTQ